MAKRSFISESRKFRRASAEILYPQESLPLGVFREKPDSPPVAYFLRRYESLRDAFRAWAADSSGGQDLRRLRADAGGRIASALGEGIPPDYSAAEKEIRSWIAQHDPNGVRASVRSDLAYREGVRFTEDRGHRIRVAPYAPEFVVAAEMELDVLGLLVAHSDPVRFFREVAPVRFVDDFHPERLSLGLTLWTWGFGALLNPNVLKAFQAAVPRDLATIFACAEGREAYREGRKKGSLDKAPRKRLVDNLETKRHVYEIADQIEEKTGEARGAVKRSVALLARREGRKPSAIRRRISRAQRNK